MSAADGSWAVGGKIVVGVETAFVGAVVGDAAVCGAAGGVVVAGVVVVCPEAPKADIKIKPTKAPDLPAFSGIMLSPPEKNVELIISAKTKVNSEF
jgi:hypothetical protein